MSSIVQVDPNVQSGAPVFAKTRVPVKNLFDYLAAGDTLDTFLGDFPSVSRAQAVAAIELAATALASSAHSDR